MRLSGTFLSRRLVLSGVLVLASISFAFHSDAAYAAQITTRRLTLEGVGTDGGSKPNGVVNHFFEFTVPTTGTAIGSIKFEYCTTASGAGCTTPTGLVTTGATLLNEGANATGFAIDATAPGAPILTRATAATPVAGALSYRLGNITNPTAVNTAFFVRISTYNSIDTTGSPIDTGTVTASTATAIELTGTMPESLIFCTGATIGVNGGGVPDCTTASAGTVEFDQLFSPTDTATATSQMAASTNATNGYSITVDGTTLTSGSNTIPAMAATATPTRGVSQFGMNLKLNTTATSTTPVGAEIAPASNGTDLRGQASTGFNTVDQFKFATGESVAASDFNTPGPTNAQIYTASYIVNVAGSQIAGTYTTTLTYICTPTF
jgi:hypothetical protein